MNPILRATIAFLLFAFASGSLVAQGAPSRPSSVRQEKAAPEAEQPKAEGAFAELTEATKAIAAGKGLEAERIVRGVLARLPRYANAWHQLALALRIQGRKADALDAIERAIAFGKGSADMHLLAAELTIAQKALGAARHVGKALELAPEDRRVLERSVELLLEAGDLDAATAALARLEGRKDGTAGGRERLLWMQADLANRKLQPEQAAKAYRALCDLVGKRDPFPHECLANTYVVLGKKSEALAAFDRCLEINPSNVTARERGISLRRDLRVDAADIEREENLLVYYRKAWELEKKAGKKGPAAPRPTQPAAPK